MGHPVAVTMAALVVLAIPAGAQPPPAPDKAGQLANARSQQVMAERALAVGEYERGMQFAEAALREREAALGPDDPLIADSALVLGVMRAKNGNRKSADQLLSRALAIRERAAKDSPAVAAALVAFAAFLRDEGDYARAEPLLTRALAIEEKAADPGSSPALARVLEELALLLAEQDDPRCEAMFRRAIDILEKAGGADAVEVAQPLKELGDLLARRGDFARAEPLYLRAMAILEFVEDLGNPRRARALLDFARVRLVNGNKQEAIALGGLAYTIDSRILGEGHPFVARDLIQLADFARANGDNARAERYIWRALTIRERALGAGHPEVGNALAELAASYAARGDVATAIKLLTRALAIFRGSLGPKHPSVATTLVSLARLSLAQNNVSAALDAMTEAGEIREASLELVLYAGSERQKRLYLATLGEETDATVSLHVQFAPTNPKATRLALLTLLRRKGRVLDAMVDTIGALRRRVSAADATLLDKLAAARSRLATLVLHGPAVGEALDAHAKAVVALGDEAQKLEAEISSKSPAFRTNRSRVTLEAVQAAIPERHALVEIASYQPLAIPGTPTGERRYAAYVLRRSGDPSWVDLGPQAPIDALVKQARAAFASALRSDAPALGRQLDARTMEPVRKLLGTTREILLSPDGALNLVPFGAFVDENGRFLIERYAITYLTTGRDLVRIAAPPPAANTTGAMIVANPDFDFSDAAARELGQRRSLDFADVVFPPLPGTAEEADALAKLLGKPSLLTADSATEGQIKRARAPIVLHVATHGFFLDDTTDGSAGSRALVRVIGTDAPASSSPTRVENPLLRSGLALAGANQRVNGDDDGVLTALEATGLDLWGTQLVVLSACETGVGEVRNGDGVYGLRRALVMAGSESQVMSLWKVDDDATRDLMINYYGKLATSAGRSEALRTAQQEMLASKDRRHPFFWASFIPSGDWRPIHGSFTSAGVKPVGPGARGCGCASAGVPSRGGLVAVIVLAFVVIVRSVRGRRRDRLLLVTAVVTLLLVPAHADPAGSYNLTLPASQLELHLQGSPNDWTVTDASRGVSKWDAFARASGPSVAIRLRAVSGPTNCLLTLNLRHHAALKAARLVTRPSYLPAEFHPDTLELATATGVTAMACADLPDGSVTAIIYYTGKDWGRDSALAKPVLTAYAVAAAWGIGPRPTAEREVNLATTGLVFKLPAGWKVASRAAVDVVARMEVGKPSLAVGVRSDIVRPLVYEKGKMVRAKLPKGAADDCDFWVDGLRVAADPNTQIVPRPAFVPRSWHAHGAIIHEPRRDQLTLCLDTRDGRWLATIEYVGSWTDPGVADAGTILQRIAAAEGKP